MHLFLKNPPAHEPITLAEAKDYLKLPPNLDEGFLRTLIAAARSYVESITGRALLKQKWEMKMTPPYPLSSPLVKKREKELEVDLPHPPLLAVESVKAGDKEVPFKVKDAKIRISSSLCDKEISLTYWAGYGETATSLPPNLKMGVLMATRLIYDHQQGDLPLLNPFKVHKLT